MEVSLKLAALFEFFRRHYANHSKAARALGVSVGLYRGMRNGRYRITPRMETYLCDRAHALGYRTEAEKSCK